VELIVMHEDQYEFMCKSKWQWQEDQRVPNYHIY